MTWVTLKWFIDVQVRRQYREDILGAEGVRSGRRGRVRLAGHRDLDIV